MLRSEFSNNLKWYRTNRILRQERNATKRAIREQVKSDYVQWLNNQCAELEIDASKKKLKRTVCEAKKISSTQTTKQRAIINKDDKLLTEPAQIKSRWQEYCSELYQQITTVLYDIVNSPNEQNEYNNETEPSISLIEINAALKHLKTTKRQD